MHGHDRRNTTILSIIHNMSTTCFGRCESQLPLPPAAITTLQYQPASPSSLRHTIDTSGNNGDLDEITDVTQRA